MKIYIAGPMRGYPDWNFAAFDKVEAELRKDGNSVFNPAQTTRALSYLPEDGADLDHLKHVMAMDIACIYAADALVLLPGWGKSSGAAVEVALAKFLGLPLYKAYTMKPIPYEIPSRS